MTSDSNSSNFKATLPRKYLTVREFCEQGAIGRQKAYDLISNLRIYARLLQTQAQKFAASETLRTACSTEGCHRYRSKGILERAEFINVPARPG